MAFFVRDLYASSFLASLGNNLSGFMFVCLHLFFSISGFETVYMPFGFFMSIYFCVPIG